MQRHAAKDIRIGIDKILIFFFVGVADIPQDPAKGRNRWSAVHRLDAARLFVLAAEKAAKDGVYHGVGEEGIATRDIAEAIGRHLNLPVVSRSGDEVAEHFGWIGGFFSYDVPAFSVETQKQLGWKPVQPGLIADLDQGHYF